MFDSNLTTPSPHHVTVLPTRTRFETAVSRILEHHADGSHGSALLHITLQSESGTGSISPRLLNLVGNALRAGMHDGEVTYLGDAEFAVFLHDTDDRQAAHYARTMAGVIGNFTAEWHGEIIAIDACIGGVMSEHCADGHTLLRMAESAGQTARRKPGCKLHMAHARESNQRAPAFADALMQPAFAS
jgi:hypothetical protein